MNFYLGNELMAFGAIYAGASSAYAYPGTPSSEILSSFAKYSPERYSQWAINEKVALELSAAAAISGSYSFCAMKQVGLNVAADPLFSVAYTGVTGALVIVSADDPGPHSSQTEQDSRMYAYSAKIPVFDPSTPQEAFDMTIKAFEISKQYGIPVMIRPVMRICHSRVSFNLPQPKQEPITGNFVKDGSRWAATPKFRSVLHQKLEEKIDLIALNQNENIKIPNSCNIAIVACGYPYSVCLDVMEKYNIQADVIKIDMPYPVSPKIIEKIENTYSKILVLEETFPLIENYFKDRKKVFGKLSATVPPMGEFTADTCIASFEKFLDRQIKNNVVFEGTPSEAPAKPRLCPGCGHRGAFFAIKRAFPTGLFPGDIGCYTLGTNLKAVDTCICMGASISFAESLKRENPHKTVIATIGDSTFFHTGIPALLNAKINSAPFVLALLDNGTTAMTGFQPVPHATGKVSMEKIIEGLGINFLRICDPYEIKKSSTVVKEAAAFAEQEQTPAVIIFRRECVTEHKKKYNNPPKVIDNCTNCGICYEIFECPAIFSDGEKAIIDDNNCNGCLCCIEVCPHHAIILHEDQKGEK